MTMRYEIDLNALDKIDAMGDAFIEKTVLPRIVNRAKRIVPVDSGELQSKIEAQSSSEGHFVVADTEYAAFVELGTSKMAAQPYLRPAMSSALPKKRKPKE